MAFDGIEDEIEQRLVEQRAIDVDFGNVDGQKWATCICLSAMRIGDLDDFSRRRRVAGFPTDIHGAWKSEALDHRVEAIDLFVQNLDGLLRRRCLAIVGKRFLQIFEPEAALEFSGVFSCATPAVMRPQCGEALAHCN